MSTVLCQEASLHSRNTTCGAPAVAIIGWKGRTDKPIPMCKACADHNVRHREGEIIHALDRIDQKDSGGGSDIIVSVAKADAMTVFTTAGEIDQYLDIIRAEIDKFIPDVTTTSGRKAIGSIAHRVARTKVALDNVGKELAAEVKRLPNQIDATRKHIRDTLENWKDEVRKPLTDWETAEEARKQAHEKAISAIHELAAFVDVEPTVDLINARLAAIDPALDREWEEFSEGAEVAASTARRILKATREAAEQRDAQRAEIERLRKEAAERAQRDRDEAAKRAAEESARAKVAEQLRKAEEERVRAIVAAEQANRDRVAAAEQAERDRVAAVEAERKRLDAEAEAKRIADARTKAEAEKRAADREHRRAVNRAAADELVRCGVDEATARAVIEVIAKGMIPRVTINY